MTGNSLETALQIFSPSGSLHEMGTALTGAIPEGYRFADEIWNIISWQKIRGRSRELYLDFKTISNFDLREIAKIYILHTRTTRRLSAMSVLNIARAIKVLDQVVPSSMSIGELKNKHFHEAQDWLIEQADPNVSTPADMAGHLARFGRFLNQHAGLRISFTRSVQVVRNHGSSGTKEGRDARLIPLEVLRDLLLFANDKNLSKKDLFFLQTFMLLVATGFRLSELFTLPANCLVERNGTVSLRYFSVKTDKFETKPVAGAFAAVVRAAVKHLQTVTAPGRRAALKARNDQGETLLQYDWSYIFRSDEAVKYFVGRLLHVWTADPRNNLFNPDGAWFERDKAYIDVLAMLERAQGNYSEVARQLNTVSQVVNYLKWAQQAMLRGELPPNSQRGGEKLHHRWDSRFVSFSALDRAAGFQIKGERATKAKPLLLEAQRLQLLGESYPEPTKNLELEQVYTLRQHAVILDKSGIARLEPHEALFTVEPYTLSNTRKTAKGKYLSS